MGNWGSDRRGGRTGGGSRGGGRSGSRGRSDRPELFDAICASCGDKCKVPFQPRNDKEVFCSDCFEDMEERGNRSGRRSDDRGDRGGRSSSGNDQVMRKLDFIENKLDRILGMLESR